MSDIAVKVENLGKMYRIGSRQEQYPTLRSALISGMKRFVKKKSIKESAQDILWALNDVSFEIKHGEVVGIIGRNGAGKSTLLKVLAHITDPTRGRVILHGRVGSLLEVGTGFHPELTGRDNIYLNGAILGMKRAEIERKFDEIVAFSEIERFLDTPVKRYSSGMYVRLAFAVAAHLEPEILVVDEVLAVGDAEFQKKCLGKMGAVAKEGRTVLFVSHNTSAIKSLCQRGIMLLHGNLVFDGSANDAVNHYVLSTRSEDQNEQPTRDVLDFPRTSGTGLAKISKVSITNNDGLFASSFAIWEPLRLYIVANCDQLPSSVSFWVIIKSLSDGAIVSSFQYDDQPLFKAEKSPIYASVQINPNILVPGKYSVSLGIFGPANEFYDWVDNVMQFLIVGEFTSGKPFDHRLGLTTIKYQWDVRNEKDA